MNALSLIRLAMMGLVRPLGPRFTATMNRVATVAVCGLLTVAFVFGAVGCAVAALWLYVAPTVGPIGAPLVCAGALLVVAGGLTLAPRLSRRRRRRGPQTAAAQPTAPVSGEAILEEIIQLFKQHKGIALAIALVVGALVGNRHHTPPP